MRLIRVLACTGSLAVWGCLSAAVADPVDLSVWRGRVIYVDFWASWCEPCRQSFPWMHTLHKAYESQGLTVVAINLDRHAA